MQTNLSENDGEGEATPSPTATIVNSKYLTLLGVSFNEADNQVTISGNISNIFPDQSFTNIVVVGELYDVENMLITASPPQGAWQGISSSPKLHILHTDQLPSSTLTMMIVDNELSLVIEEKKYEDPVGIATYSNNKSTIFSYVPIFENL